MKIKRKTSIFASDLPKQPFDNFCIIDDHFEGWNHISVVQRDELKVFCVDDSFKSLYPRVAEASRALYKWMEKNHIDSIIT